MTRTNRKITFGTSRIRRVIVRLVRDAAKKIYFKPRVMFKSRPRPVFATRISRTFSSVIIYIHEYMKSSFTHSLISLSLSLFL